MGQLANSLKSILERAMFLHQQGDTVQAEAMYRQVLDAEPNEPNAWHLLGVLAWQRNDLKTAEEQIRKAIQIHRAVSAYHSNLGGVLKQKGDIDGAIESYEYAFKLSPDDEKARRELAQLLHAHGQSLMDAREWDAGTVAYKRTLEIDPYSVSTLNNLAAIIQHRGDRAGARLLYDRALALMPENLLLRYNRAICYLTEGKLAEGWADFTLSEPYWRDKQDNRPDLPWMSVPLWNGAADLNGKKILIWGDQGIGDEILYMSSVPDLVEWGAVVTIETNRRLVPLVQRSFPDVTALSRETQPLPGTSYDFHAPGMWLACCARPTLDSFPKRQSYLKADPVKIEQLRQRYKAFGKKQIIGLSWFTQSYAWGIPRSVQLPDLLKALPLDDIVIIDLQYGDTKEAWHKARKYFPNLTVFHDGTIDQLKNMDDYAAQIGACDKVVTICNTTAHVAGSLGVPTVVLMAVEGLTWYWFETGENCPWYPSIKLLRPTLQDRIDAVTDFLDL